jgi:hypothetical protein
VTADHTHPHYQTSGDSHDPPRAAAGRPTRRRAADPLAQVLPRRLRAGLHPSAVAWLRRLLDRGEWAAGGAPDQEEAGAAGRD